MIVAYVQGGGLGHLTRVRAALHTLRRTGPVTLVSSSPFANDPRVVGDAAVVTVHRALAADPDGARVQLTRVLAELAPSELVVDAFPWGLAGELDASVLPDGVPVTHLARSLRWDRYRAALPSPEHPLPLTTTYVLEPLVPDHLDLLTGWTRTLEPLDLVDPPEPGAVVPPAPGDRPRWLVVHAGPPAEVAELVAYAEEQAELEVVRPELVVLAPGPHASADDRAGDVSDADATSAPHWVDAYPAWPWFVTAERIFSGAGFNVVRQLAPHRDRHRMLPFARRFDDQFARARRARAEQPGP